MRKKVVQLYIKNNEVIFSLAWNMIFSDNFKVLVLQFFEIKNMVFLSRKVDGNMIFTDYWKVLVLNFSEMGNTVFSWAKKLTEIWYLLITGKFLFWTFRWWEIRSFFESRSWWKDDIYWLLKSSCFELFGDRNRVFFWVKKLIERWYLLVTEKFVFWTLRWWEIRSFFSQKVDGKMIFAWSFWAFHDIPGLGKHCFLRSVFCIYLCYSSIWITVWIIYLPWDDFYLFDDLTRNVLFIRKELRKMLCCVY